MLTQGLMIVLAAASAPMGADAAAAPQVLDSYTQAYNAADGKPMLVVLNSGSQPAADIDISELTSDAKLAGALEDYVVAAIDTTTDHGRKVFELFDSPTLPYVVVIDSDKKQVFKNVGSVTTDELVAAVSDSTVTAYRPIMPVSEPIASSVVGSSVVVSEPASQPVYSSPIVESVPMGSAAAAPVYAAPSYAAPSLTVPSMMPAAPKSECKACQKYRAYQF